jgi:hypothetical protein
VILEVEMAREPNNQASELMDRFGKHWFFCIENTAETSPMDLDDFVCLLNQVSVQ